MVVSTCMVVGTATGLWFLDHDVGVVAAGNRSRVDPKSKFCAILINHVGVLHGYQCFPGVNNRETDYPDWRRISS